MTAVAQLVTVPQAAAKSSRTAPMRATTPWTAGWPAEPLLTATLRDAAWALQAVQAVRAVRAV